MSRLSLGSQEGAKQKCAPRENNKSLLKEAIFSAKKLQEPQEPREYSELLVWISVAFWTQTLVEFSSLPSFRYYIRAHAFTDQSACFAFLHH